MRQATNPGFAACVLLLCVGCQSYQARPLKPDDILEQIEQSRQAPSEGEVVTLQGAARILAENNPRVLETQAAQRTRLAVADVKTPLPNPVLFAGPIRFPGQGNSTGTEVALGWKIPLGGQLKFNDELNDMTAEAAGVEVGAVLREEYLELRREYVQAEISARAWALRKELHETVEISLGTTRQLVEAGPASELDVRELELEAHRTAAAEIGAQEDYIEARNRIAARTGVAAKAFRVDDRPDPPAEVPAIDSLHAILLRDHPELGRLRAAYRVSEKRLRLEVARQYPSLEIGLSFERELGFDRWALPIGIDLPIFDRNQLAIAEARAEREEHRVRYEAQVRRALVAIEAAHARLVARRARWDLFTTKVLPTSEATLALARRALDAGEAAPLRFLSALRADRVSRLEALDAARDLFDAWFDLERACGAPIVAFPEEEESK